MGWGGAAAARVCGWCGVAVGVGCLDWHALCLRLTAFSRAHEEPGAVKGKSALDGPRTFMSSNQRPTDGDTRSGGWGVSRFARPAGARTLRWGVHAFTVSGK